MGSTQGSNTRDIQTLNPARNLVQRGRFDDALRALGVFITDRPNYEALMLEAICHYRLGDQLALDRLEDEYGDKLSIEQLAVMFRHEVLGHISAAFRQPDRFDEALDLLEANAPTPREQMAQQNLRRALRILRNGEKRVAEIGVLVRRPEREGINNRAEVRAPYLSRASVQCAAALAHVGEDGPESLTYVLAKYMTLLVELSKRDGVRSNALFYQTKAELQAIDAEFARSLPSLRRHKFFRYTIVFRPGI